MKIIVAGSRHFTDYEFVKGKMDNLFLPHFKPEQIICGMCPGADLLGKRWAEENGIDVIEFPANFKLLGKAAGPVRNAQMAEYGDGLILFWNGKSKGSANMLKCMEILGKPTLKYRI